MGTMQGSWPQGAENDNRMPNSRECHAPLTFDRRPCSESNLTFTECRPLFEDAGIPLNDENLWDLGLHTDEGAYTNEKGALGTYTYLDSSELPTPKPVVSAHKTSDGSDRKNIPYQYNAVTSMFYLYTGSSTSADSNFCVFGVLADDESSTRFDELLDAIDSYEQAMQDEDDNYSFTEVQDMRIDDAMTEFGYYTAEFNIPKVKIVIESIEVTSY